MKWTSFFKQITKCAIPMMTSENLLTVPQRLGAIEGLAEKRNDIIYCRPNNQRVKESVVFFGGDIQNYKEEMLAHRDNKYYADWDLESTAVLLQNHFPAAEITIIKPSKMALNTFCCYENFVEVNNFGAPNYEIALTSLKHLQLLLQNVSSKIRPSNTDVKDLHSCNIEFQRIPLIIIGFSKGCVVLNQLLYAFNALISTPDDEISNFVKKIKVMYWLEGGHSGLSETWVTDKDILKNFQRFEIKVEIHVTPYQVLCDTRPRIGKEEKVFRDVLKRLGVTVNRQLHFKDEPRSLENHFLVLKTFKREN